MAGSGQTLNDRLNAARYALAGQGLARTVCKATTEEVLGPKKKHLDYLLQCTHEPNVSIPQLANLLIERTNHSSWVVVFKALVTVHHLMCYGNERFTQYLASSNCNFQLTNFLDKAGVKGYEMSTFIRRYAKYLNEKALSYRTVAFDFTKIKRGKEDGSLRLMNTDKLLKTIPSLQSQVDILLEFDCSANDLMNGVINAAFMLLFRDLIRLFACYNDGIINCLEKFFDMNKKHAREALDIYKRFLIRMDRVAEFLKVAENVGIDKGEIPDLTKAPGSLLDALEQHLNQLEGKKGQTATKKETNGNASANGSIVAEAVNGASKDPNDPAVRKALEEEEQIMSRLKSDRTSHKIFDWEQEPWPNLEKHIQEQTMKSNNPFLSSPTAETLPSPSKNISAEKSQGILDLFNDSSNSVANAIANNSNNSNQSGKASDDLLCLGNANPFADILNAANTSAPLTTAAPFASVPISGAFQQPPMSMGMGMNPMFNNGTNANTFASDAGFAAAFGNGTTATSASSGNDRVNDNEPDLSETAAGREETVTDQTTDTLPVPGEDNPNRTASPSPTHDITMRGAGTTPILSHPPEPGFGEDDTGNVSRGNTPSPAKKIRAPPPSGENSPFGPPFEPPVFPTTFNAVNEQIKLPPPSRPPPPDQDGTGGHSAPPVRPPPPSSNSPVPESDLFGDSEGFCEEHLASTQPPPRPPVPGVVPNAQFAAFDAFDAATQQQILMQQQLAYQQMVAQQQAVLQQQAQQQPKKGVFEDLDMAMRETMAKPQQPIGQATQQQSNQQQGMFVMPQGFVFVPGQYGGFDAFGDVLQPQQLSSKSSQSAAPVAQSAAITTPTSAANQGLFKGDLDSSLASLAQNLDINGPKGGFKKPGQQFSSPKNTVKTGAPTTGSTGNTNPNWPMGGTQPMAWNATAGAPMVPQPGMVAGAQWTGGAVPQMMMPTNTMPMMPQGYTMQMRPGMGSIIPPGAVPVLPGAGMMANSAPMKSASAAQSDPFGAL